MRLPWNRKYLEICFHVLITVLALAGTGLLLFRLPAAKNVILHTVGQALTVFAPVLWALFFTLLLEPLVGFFQRQYVKRCSLRRRSRIHSRRAGTAFAYLSVLLFLILAGGWSAKKIGGTDLERIAEQIGGYLRSAGDLLVLLNLKLAEYGVLRNVEGMLSAWTDELTEWIQRKILGFAGILPGLGGSLLDIVIGATAAFYFLMEKEKILAFLREASAVCFGERFTKGTRRIFREIYSVFSGYLSGQMLDAAIMAVLFSAAFSVVGLPYAVCFAGLDFGFFQPDSLFWGGDGIPAGGIYRPFERYAAESLICLHTDPSAAAGRQPVYCTARGRQAGRAASGAGTAFAGGVRAADGLLGAVVCSTARRTAEKFLFLVL